MEQVGSLFYGNNFSSYYYYYYYYYYYQASKVSPTHTFLIKILVYIMSRKICGPDATYEGVTSGQGFGAKIGMRYLAPTYGWEK